MYQEYMEQLLETIKNVEVDEGNITIPNYEESMEKIIGCITFVKQSRKKLFFIGNGGSAAIASHMTTDFMKNGGIKTYNFYDLSLVTCMSNDYGYENVFSVPLELYGDESDLLIAISSSGNSQNIINGIEEAKRRKMGIITFSGFKKDNIIRSMGNYNVYVPISHYGIVESIHNIILQQAVDEILKRDGIMSKQC